jgi:predicted MPP superfamily phosphohydrolase
MYWIRGNHDARLSRRSFSGTSLRNVEGERLVIETGHGPVELIGLPGPKREDLTDEFVRSLPAKQAGMPRIMMSHYPDHIRKLLHHGHAILPDVYLAGHTHGGQACLPGGFAPLRHDSLPQSLCRGVHRWAHGWFVVSRGLGFSSYKFRVLCPAEVVELRLVAQAQSAVE